MSKLSTYGGEEDVRLAQTRITAKQAGGLVKVTGDATVSVTVGQTTTLAPGTEASVTNSGNDVDVVLNFSIPSGLTGAKGDKGATGADGAPGADAVITDGSITRTKLETKLVDELKYDQGVMAWTGSQAIANNVSFNLLSLFTPALITRNTMGLVLNNTSKVLTLTPRDFDQNIRAVVRLIGTIGGTAGTPREFFVELTRPTTTGALIARDSIVKINDSTINSRQASLDTYVVGGTTDLFFTQGFEIKLNNVSTQSITLTGVTILFFG